MRLYTIFAFLLLLIASALLSQNNTAKFYSLTTKDGLSSNEVNCIFKDSKGFMWFGTKDGLNKYDGLLFTVYKNNPAHAQSINGSNIHSITEDAQGEIWVATDGGLNKFQRETETFRTYHYNSKNGAASFANSKSILLADFAGYLWVAQADELIQLDPKTGKGIEFLKKGQLDKIIKGKSISFLFEDSYHYLWIGVWNSGIVRLDAERRKIAVFQPHTSNDKYIDISSVISAYEDKNRQLWFGTHSGGLYLFNPQKQQFSPISSPFIKTEVTAIVSMGNQLWVGQGHSVAVLDGLTHRSLYQYTHQPDELQSYTPGYATTVYKDKMDIVWFGTSQTGISYYNPNRSRFLPFYIDIHLGRDVVKSPVRAFYYDKNGNTWIGTHGKGLLSYHEKTNRFTAYTTSNSALLSDIITAICPLQSGRYWLGTSNGITVFDPQRKQVIGRLQHSPTLPNSLISNSVLHLFEDSRQWVWVATESGLDLIQKGKFTHFNKGGLGKYEITDLIEDKNGDIWIATHYGLYRYDGRNGRIKEYFNQPGEKSSLNSSEILSLYVDSKGLLWAGTRKGLNCFDAKTDTFKPYLTKHGWMEESVFKIIEDKNGFLWMTTTSGMSRLNPLTAVMKNYDERDGLNNSFTALSINNQGTIYVGGLHTGFYKFKPSDIKDNKQVPSVYITQLLLFNKAVIPMGGDESAVLQKSISHTKQISLAYDQTVLEFKVAALNYTLPEKNRFAYKLEGFDKEWVYLPVGKNSIIFANLFPGKYTLKVKGSNNDGLWNEDGVSLDILVRPPFWQSYWAYFFYFIILTLLLFEFRFYSNRTFKLKSKGAMDQMKLQFFTNVSHELRTPLTLISGPLNSLISEVEQGLPTKQRLLEQFSLMQRNTERLLLLTNQLLELQKSETGTLQLNLSDGDLIPFIENLYAAFVPMAESKNIQFRFSASEEKLETSFDPDKLEKIVLNLLSNAFKFTQTTVKLSVWKTNQQLLIVVEDDGIGIAKDKLARIFDNFYQVDNSSTRENEGSGIGLALTRELVLLHKGTIHAESEVGKGTKMVVKLPILQQTTNVKFQPEGVEFQTIDVVKLPTADYPLPTTNYPLPTTDYPLVLIVEDNADLRLYIRDVLGDAYRVSEAENGRMGVEQALELMPDLIISDVMMPEMGGMELCHTLKNDVRTSHIPIILLTALSGTDSQLKGLKTGADDYVTKPFNAELLLARIKNLVAIRKRLHLKFQHAVSVDPTEIVTNVADEKFLKKAIDLVEKNIEDFDFDIRHFIAGMNMSRTNLYVKMKALTGQSVSDFIKSIRLRRAAQLLLTKEFTVSEICFKVGFQERSQFYRAFKEQFMMSPTEYIHSNLHKE